MRLFQGAYDSTVADDWPCGQYAKNKDKRGRWLCRVALRRCRVEMTADRSRQPQNHLRDRCR